MGSHLVADSRLAVDSRLDLQVDIRRVVGAVGSLEAGSLEVDSRLVVGSQVDWLVDSRLRLEDSRVVGVGMPHVVAGTLRAEVGMHQGSLVAVDSLERRRVELTDSENHQEVRLDTDWADNHRLRVG